MSVATTVPQTRADAALGWLRRRSRRTVAASQLVLLGLTVWLLVVPQVRRSSSSLGLVLHVNGWIAFAVLAELVSLGAYALTTLSMLPPASRPSLFRVLRIDLSSIALGHCLPDGGAAGTALSWRLLVADGVPSAQAAFAKVAQGIFAAIVLQVLLLGAFGLGLPTTGLGRWNSVPAALCLAVLVLVALCVLALRRPAVRAAARQTLARLPRYGARIAAGTTHLYRRHLVEQLRGTFLNRGTVFRAATFAATNWLFDAVALWACVAAFGDSVGLEGLATAIAIQTFAAWLPLTPSGLGISDGLMIPALMAFGASSTSAVMGVLAWRVLAYWLPMPLGALAYGSLRLRRRTAQASAA